MTPDELKALRHIVKNGDDRNLSDKKWRLVKSSLFYKGLLRRRIGDWAWIATKKGLKESNDV